MRRYAGQKESEAAGQVSLAVKALHQAQTLLRDLQEYRDNYMGATSNRQHWDSTHWADYNDFLGRLAAAIAAQEEIISHHQNSLDVLRRSWQETHARTQSLDHLDQRFGNEERLTADRITQKEADARALMKPISS